jgi:hypothetical protein
MKSSLNKTLLALLATLALLIGTSSSAAIAADVIKTSSFTGFAFEKSTLTPAMKAAIKTWVDKNATSSFTFVSCTGYTGFNVKKREQDFLQKLAEARALAVCNYVKTLKNVLTVRSTQGIPGNGETASARKVTVRLIAPDDQGGGGGNEGGTGEVVIGVCDNALTVTMRSRIASSEFYFASITIKNIATTCKSKVIDIYLLDADGNQLGVSTGNPITTTQVLVTYTSFSPNAIKSNEIKKVAFELRAP